MRSATALLAVAVVLSSCGSTSGVEAGDAWSRPVPPVSPAQAIYLELSNGTDSEVTLTSAESDACRSIELHETAMDDNNVMMMRPLAGGLELGPGEVALLAPGGIHLMCLEPQTGLESFDVALRLRGAEDVVARVTVEDR